MPKPTAVTWGEYINQNLPSITNLLNGESITLNNDQPHIKGERFLMQALTTLGGKKIILIGHSQKDNRPVVIKVATDTDGANEIKHERLCRDSLKKMDFAYDQYFYPKELLFKETKKFTIIVNEFIDQTGQFIDRDIETQFELILNALNNQAQAQATTAKHLKSVIRTFGSRNSSDYINLHKSFVETCHKLLPDSKIQETLQESHKLLEASKVKIDRYGYFLTHTDFVPHNFRIKDGVLYYLDSSSFRFANKHEGWARLLNFMTLYNRKLERLLIEYVENNYAVEERESLQLMRIHRLGEIITYYVNTLKNSSGDLLTLNSLRVDFWHEVLKAELKNQRVSQRIVDEYIYQRDQLRSVEEKQRQVGLH